MKSEFTIKKTRCKGCSLCATFCPKNVLEVDTLGKVFVARHENCIACGQCERVCPDFAIFVDKIKPEKEAAK